MVCNCTKELDAFCLFSYFGVHVLESRDVMARSEVTTEAFSKAKYACFNILLFWVFFRK